MIAMVQECAVSLKELGDSADKIQFAEGEGHVVDGRTVHGFGGRENPEVDQQGGTKDTDDGAAAEEILDDRGMVADPAQDGSEHDHKQEAAGHPYGQYAQVGGRDCHRGDDQEDRQGKVKQLERFFLLGYGSHRHSSL